MSAGDIYSTLVNIASGAYLTFQPAVGVEYVITIISSYETFGTIPNRCPFIKVEVYNGSIISYITDEDNNVLYWMNWKVYITNDIYLRVYNAFGSATSISIQGLQTK